MRKIEPLVSGRFKVRFRIGGRQSSETFDRKKDATDFAKWLDALGPQGALDRLYEGEQDKTVPTMDELAADHIRLLTGIEPGTRLRYQRLWDRTWSPLIGRTPAHRLTADDVRGAVNHLALRYSEKSLKNQRGLLAGVCGRAVELGYQHKILTKGIRLSRGTAEGHEAEEMVLLAPSEWPLLYEALTPHYRPLARFLVGTGARWGEAVALRVGEVNVTHANVKLIRALKDSPDGNRYVGVTKTRKSKRTIALPAEVLEDLRPLLRHKAGSDLVFTAPRGGMVLHRTFWSDHWRPALWRAQHCPEHTDPACRCGTAHPKRCKVHDAPPPACGCDGTLRQSPRIHDLRHTHASWLLGRGVPLNVVQARLGHESIQTTVDTYSHLLPDAQQVAASAASLAFSVRTPIEA